MSLLDAAYQVLKQAGQPRSSAEIIARVLKDGLWQSHGATPKSTLDSQLAVDIRKRGTDSRFQRTAPGVFALREWDCEEYTGAHGRHARRRRTHPPTSVTLSFTDAAEKVLLESADKKPMHYRAITDQALSAGLVQTSGRTPAATMFSQILMEIARKQKRGEQPRFVKWGEGLVGLSRWLGTGLEFEIQQHNNSIRKKLKAQLLAMHPGEFETLIGRLLGEMGFDNVTVTPLAGDGGIDARGILVVGDVIRTKMAVQVKRWQHNVQKPTIQQVRGALGAHEHGLIITTSKFSAGAKEEAQRPDVSPVALMDGDQLVALLVEYGIGVRRTTHDLIELGGDESKP